MYIEGQAEIREDKTRISTTKNESTSNLKKKMNINDSGD